MAGSLPHEMGLLHSVSEPCHDRLSDDRLSDDRLPDDRLSEALNDALPAFS
ncbi:hypothetical protein [Dickeya solani]|uniref:Uncharacterized protein n=1 Tax=Dickeya solani TaxID=1089444 RepID=A0ABU4EMU1_9GAMM|nr:hypothetical protein [Dickeya solani]MCA7000922.1 hypothetical protein [Dickeya solani]MCZ0821736.1 hypothetical protein [Dickeya solani]MDV6994915.1 hypothetical protein [Dickeya solani]MDV7006336.1 hypothetical protein [Dickeya solani]MDV7036927.1 hypothetical protein [Dickeya solani]